MASRKSRIWYIAGVLLLIVVSAAVLVLIVDRLAPIDGDQGRLEQEGRAPPTMPI